MPCKGCPDDKAKVNSAPCDQIPDREFCRLAKLVREVEAAKEHFRRHLALTTCRRCMEVAVQIQKLLDIYARMLINAENYKLEKARLLANVERASGVLNAPAKEEKLE